MDEMLYKKYRPQNFENFFGNHHIITIIKNSVLSRRVAHAYLFSGSRGTGKTSLARLIVKSINCLEPIDGFDPCLKCTNCISISTNKFMDMIELDAASNRGIEEIREIKNHVNYKPIASEYKVYIIDEVHMLTKEAFNALLKVLEEPPRHVIFILATTEPEKVPDTVKSRCQRHDFKLLDGQSILIRLKDISSKEGRAIDDESLEIILKESGFSMRDALSLLEKVFTSHSGDITRSVVVSALGLVPSEILAKFYKAYISKDLKEMLSIIDNVWIDGYKIEMLMRDLAFELRKNIFKLDSLNLVNEIEKIYSSINEFRFEEDKRAVGYIVCSRLLGNLFVPLDTKKEVIEVKEIKQEEVIDLSEPKLEKSLELAIPRESISQTKDIGKEPKEIKEDVKTEAVLDNKTTKLKEKETAKLSIQKGEIPKESRATLYNKIAVDGVLDSAQINPIKSVDNVDNSAIFNKIKDNWNSLINKVKDRSISVMLFLMNSRLGTMKNNVLEIFFDKEHIFHKESLEKIENRLILEDFLSKEFQMNISVSITLLEKDVMHFKDKVEQFLEEYQ